jgi:hypothetical protein
MRGYVDRFNTTIAGWAFDPERPDQPVEISVSHGAHELYRCKADLFRSDLVPVLGSGNHGFSFDPANIDSIADKSVLTIRAHGTQSMLLKEEQWIRQSIVAEGSDGWLFLQNDSNDVNRRMAGLVGNDVARINETAMSFVMREAMLSRFGIDYRAIIIPEKNVICARYWPQMQVSEARPVPRIIAQAASFGSRVLYPAASMLQDPDKYYLKTDTHMSADGCEHILSVLQPELPELFGGIFPAPRRENAIFCGDLGSKLKPPKTEATAEFCLPCCGMQEVLVDQVSTALKSGSALRGCAKFVRNAAAQRRKLLLFGTSSAYHFLPVVAQLFSEVLFVWENTFDYSLIKRFEPDCVLWLVTERFLPTGCNDMLGLPDTLAYLENIASAQPDLNLFPRINTPAIMLAENISYATLDSLCPTTQISVPQ